MNTTATAAAPAAPKTAAAPAAAKPSTPPATTAKAPTTAAPAKTPESPATKAPVAKAAAKPVAKKAAPAKAKAKAKPQTKAKAPPQTPAGDKAEASAKAAVGTAMNNSAAANKHSTTAKADAKPNVPAGAQGNAAADRKAKQDERGMGDNSMVTHAEIEEAAKAAGDALGGIMKGDAKIERTKEQAQTLRKEAANRIFPIFERLGIEQGTEAKEAKQIDEYEKLRLDTCTAIAKKAGMKLEYNTKGTPKIPGAINKHWSRLWKSYNEGGDGGQTQADKRAREAAKDRTKEAKAKAEMLDNVLIAHAGGNTEQVDTLLKSARGRWGKALNL